METNSAPGTATPHSWQPPPAARQHGHWQCECGKTLRFDWLLSGKKGRCPACGRNFTIPALAPAEGAAATLRGHNGAIRTIGFSPDGRLVATAAEVVPSVAAKSELAETVVWDAATGLPSTTLHWHRDAVISLAFSPDGRWLATGSKDHTVSLWNVERGLWDAVMGVHEHSLYGHQAPVTAVAFAPDGALLVTAAADQTLRFWDAAQWQLTKTIEARRKGDGQIAFSPCGRYLAVVWSSRGPVTLWNASTGERHLELRLPTEEDSDDYGVGFIADGSKLVVLGHHQVRIWDLSTCQVLASFEATGSESLAVSPRAAVIATGGFDPETNANVTLWDAATLLRMREFDGHSQSVAAIAFSRDGKMLASGGRDGIANLWAVGP